MIVNYFFCSETNDIFLVECPGGKRTREVLEKIIVDHVEVGTKIITDGWKAYQHLEELGFYMFSFYKKIWKFYCDHAIFRYKSKLSKIIYDKVTFGVSSTTISTMSTRTQGIIPTKLSLPGLPSKGLFHVEDRTTSRGYL